MDGTIDFIILEHDDVARCALIAGALREVRNYCKDATEKRDPQLICAKAQAAASKSAAAEGDAGGKKL